MMRHERWLRPCLLILLWIPAFLLLRPAVTRATSIGQTPFFDALIAMVLATAAIVGLDMFWRPTVRRVLLKLLAIGVLLALTLPLAWCSAVSHWGQ
jgi:hypothetical protein